MEQQILSLCLNSREDFALIDSYDILGSLSDLGKEIYKYAKNYYDTDKDANKVDRDLLLHNFRLIYNDKQFAVLEQALKNTPNETVSTKNLISLIKQTKQQNIALSLASDLLTPARKRAKELIKKYLECDADDCQECDSTLDLQLSLDSILDESDDSLKIKVLPKDLNNILEGGIFPGNNILIYGAPEVGKSLFAINMACGFIANNLKILYICNEDPKKQMLPRFVYRLTNKNKHEVRNEKNKINQILEKHNFFNNLIYCDASPGSVREIESWIDQIKPDIVIIDQLKNVNINKQDSKVEMLENLGKFSREMGKKYGAAIINIAQAGDSANNKLTLDMGDVYFSNTGIPGTMDLMIGIGSNEDYQSRNMRRVSIPKNKISGTHQWFDVVIDPQLTKVISIQ